MRKTILIGSVLLSLLSCSAVTMAQPRHMFNVIAKTGQVIDCATESGTEFAQIKALGTGPSINDGRKVAFVARTDSTEQGRLVVMEDGAVPYEEPPKSGTIHLPVERCYPVTSPATIAEWVQINNFDQVIWHQGFEDGLVTYVQRLDTADGGVTLGRGSLVPAFPAPFDILRPWTTLNNAGRGVFSAVVDSVTVLATRDDGSGPYDVSGPTTGNALLYPMIADNNTILVRAGGATNDPLILFSDQTLDAAYFIAEPPEFVAVGEAPGISDDGVFIAFVGHHHSGGIGIYGEIGGGIPPFKIAGLSGPFGAFTLQARTGVNRTIQSSSGSYTVAYVAFDKTARLGLYTSQVDISDRANVRIGEPSLVIQVGQSLPDLPADPIANIRVYDPISNGGHLVFWVERGTPAKQAIVRACPDDDGDGLCNSWEVEGIRDGKGNVLVDLPAMGADPRVKDIFVEVDYMDCVSGGDCAPNDTHSHKPWDEAIDRVISGFFKAPVDCHDPANPSACQGIRLHVDNGPTSVMNPVSVNPVRGEVWGSLSRSNLAVDATGVLVSDPMKHGYDFGLPDAPCDERSLKKAFADVKAARQARERRLAFHYVVFVHNRCDGAAGGGTFADIGVTVMSLGRKPGNSDIGDVWDQAGAFMHELGHQLGLDHGGGDGINSKPNYLSVMNYSFQRQGLTINATHPEHPGTPAYPFAIEGHFDYSRFESPGDIARLDENALDEIRGLVGTQPRQPGSPNPPISAYGTIYYCPATRDGHGKLVASESFLDRLGSPVDWNCDHRLHGSVAANITGVLYPLPERDPQALDVLRSQNDWARLVYTLGSIGGGLANGAPAADMPRELTEEEAAQLPRMLGVKIQGPMGNVLPPGATGRYDFVVRNTGERGDTYSVKAISTRGWVDSASANSTVRVGPGRDAVVPVKVRIPGDAASDEADDIRVEVRSLTNPTLLDLATVRTAVSTDGGNLAVTSVSVPSPVTITAGRPITRLIVVQVENRGVRAEVIADGSVLNSLVRLTIESLGACPAPTAIPRLGAVEKRPLTLKPKQKLSLIYDVKFDCANDPAGSTPKQPGHEDFRVSVEVDHDPLGGTDWFPEDDVCPRSVPPGGLRVPWGDSTFLDKGCGGRKPDGTLGAPILIDVLRR